MIEYENLLEWMQSRRSVRLFTERPVAREDILKVLEPARWAPSNHNRQPWKFLILEDAKQIASLAGEIRHDLDVQRQNLPALAAEFGGELLEHATLFARAPVVIIALHKQPVRMSARLLQKVKNPNLVSGEPLSVAMAVQNILLAAPALGLGTCVMTAPMLAVTAWERHSSWPPGYELNCLIAMGYPKEIPMAPRRKKLDHSVVFWQDITQQDNDQETNI